MSDKSITTLEDLSDDVLFEIFEYFHGEQLFRTFHGLTRRINIILNDSRLLMHIDFERIVFMQTLYDINEIQFVNLALSRVDMPLISADFQSSSVMPKASQLSIDKVYLPDLIVGLASIKSKMPNLTHVSIKTYHQATALANNIVFIIENILDLLHIRVLALNFTYDSPSNVYTCLSGTKSSPTLERLSIIGCNLELVSIIDLIRNSPQLHAIQMKLQQGVKCQDYSPLRQITRANLKLIGFNEVNLKKFFRSMTNIVKLRLDDETTLSIAHLYISHPARIAQIPIGFNQDW